MADYLLKYSMGELLQMLKKDNRRPKFIEIILYTKKGNWMLTRLKASMKGSLQVVFEKADKQESIVAARREVNKETGLSVTQFQWLINDRHYDYDLYICNIEKFKS